MTPLPVTAGFAAEICALQTRSVFQWYPLGRVVGTAPPGPVIIGSPAADVPVELAEPTDAVPAEEDALKSPPPPTATAPAPFCFPMGRGCAPAGGTTTLTWLQTVVGVAGGVAAGGGAVEMVYEKAKLPLSVVALRADRTWCSAGPFPRWGTGAGLWAAAGLVGDPAATNATGTATRIRTTTAATTTPTRRQAGTGLDARPESSSSQSPLSATTPPSPGSPGREIARCRDPTRWTRSE